MTRSALAALAVAIALPARAGVTLQYEDDQKRRTTLELEGKKLRSASDAGRAGGSAIFDGDQRVFYTLDDAGKTYHRLDEATGAAMGAALQGAMEQARAKMTPEQRARMEAYLAKRQAGGEGAPAAEHAWKYERASGGQKVAGYACDNYRVLRDGKLESETCFVPWGTGGLRKEDFQAVGEMGRFLRSTLAAMGPAAAAGRHAPGQDWASRFLEAAPGIPAVMDRVDDGGKRTHELRLVRAERGSVPASRFVPPADYREQPLGGRGGE